MPPVAPGDLGRIALADFEMQPYARSTTTHSDLDADLGAAVLR